MHSRPSVLGNTNLALHPQQFPSIWVNKPNDERVCCASLLGCNRKAHHQVALCQCRWEDVLENNVGTLELRPKFWGIGQALLTFPLFHDPEGKSCSSSAYRTGRAVSI